MRAGAWRTVSGARRGPPRDGRHCNDPVTPRWLGRAMKALLFGGPGQRSWESADDPGINEPTDIIVKVDATTICGTDLLIL